MAITKFKVGQKVKLLPSIVTRCISGSEIGKIGVITAINTFGTILVKTDKYNGWCVQEDNIVPAMIKGQQLLLWEDMYE